MAGLCWARRTISLRCPERIWCRFIREKDRTIRGADQEVAERTPFFPGDARIKASPRAPVVSNHSTQRQVCVCRVRDQCAVSLARSSIHIASGFCNRCICHKSRTCSSHCCRGVGELKRTVTLRMTAQRFDGFRGASGARCGVGSTAPVCAYLVQLGEPEIRGGARGCTPYSLLDGLTDPAGQIAFALQE